MKYNLSFIEFRFILVFILIVTTTLCFRSIHEHSKESQLHQDRKLIDRSTFLWGVATAAYQIEGATKEDGKGVNIWDTFIEIPGKIHAGDTADIADDSYHKFQEDVELVKAMGMKSYRFSISWARILPKGYGDINSLGVAYYNKLIDLLVEANIEPLVTLYHWDLPQNLHDEYGGWLSPDIEKHFSDYADVCFREFGDRVKLWATMNEPWSFAYLGYGSGLFAPGRCSDRSKCPEGDSSTEPYIVAHNVLNSHASAVELYRTKYQSHQNGYIGIVLNLDWAEPYTSSESDETAAQTRREFALSWFADPIYFGHYPFSMIDAVGDRLPQFTDDQIKRLQGSIDFFTLNHYTSKYFKYMPNSGRGWAEDQQNEESKYASDGSLIGPQGQSDWLNVVPWGIYKLLMWVTDRYTIDNIKPIIIISENGFDVFNETSLPIKQALHDVDRISYYSQYFEEIKHAVRDGANIQGYYAWSLLDNFEWADGYSCRFGLHYVDYKDSNRPRYPKDSSKWYGTYAKTHPNGFYEINSSPWPWTSSSITSSDFSWYKVYQDYLIALSKSTFFPARTRRLKKPPGEQKESGIVFE